MLHDDSIEFLFRLFAHDMDTAYHSCRVSGMVEKMTEYLMLPVSSREIYFSAALLHDIGKAKIASQILQAPRALETSEWELMHQHPTFGENLARCCEYPEQVCKLIRWHHERIDGSGYPDGLKGNDVNEGTRIIGLCDTVDAVLRKRPYHPERSRVECMSIIQKENGKFDEKYIEVLDEFWDSIII